jgi:tetratricopeptide (TPR) repeat protein
MRRRLSVALTILLVAGAASMARADVAADVAAAHAAVQRGDDSGAIRLLTRALARPEVRGVQRAEIYVARGGILERLKRYPAVISDMQHAIALRPHDWVAYYGLGVGYHFNGEPKKAIEAYNRGIAAASPDVALFNGRGRAYQATGDLRRARADFEHAIALNPRYLFPYENLGMLDYEQLRYDAAFADFDRVVQLAPERADGYQWRGATAFLRNQPAAARADLDKAIALDPKFFNAYRWRGLVNFTDREFSDAAVDFETAARLRPTLPYNVLWAYIARLKLKTADAAALRTASSRFDERTWPGPVFALFLGERTYAEVLARATAGVPPATAAGNRCEAAFYAGELALSRDDAGTARGLLDEAVRTCPVHYTEHDGAVAELRWLDAQPSPSASPM